jgi:hypothetical protein
VEPIFRELGVRVVHRLTLSRYGELINTAEVFILFSHWSDNCIEFADGLRKVADVASIIPVNYDKILDLCVCRSEPLVSAVRGTRPHCLVRYVAERAVIPRDWLLFFMVLFRYLSDRRVSYIQALEVVVQEFLSKRKGW